MICLPASPIEFDWKEADESRNGKGSLDRLLSEFRKPTHRLGWVIHVVLNIHSRLTVSYRVNRQVTRAFSLTKLDTIVSTDHAHGPTPVPVVIDLPTLGRELEELGPLQKGLRP